MAYSNFTLETVQKTFQLEKIESTDIFSHIEPVEPSEDLTKELAKKVPCSEILGILSSMIDQKA
ncbi:hypothetical protein F4009_07470 [Candidatus Poribacteria bacterium]|nr:hypothetical protein [Candidatus Poribacteria bacterium]MYH80499.1 hypothetical protein [Candidatus Poribacteria bacterium]MYK93827.1 hypothetical protein [Candidatus Poribacteria bacterium]